VGDEVGSAEGAAVGAVDGRGVGDDAAATEVTVTAELDTPTTLATVLAKTVETYGSELYDVVVTDPTRVIAMFDTVEPDTIADEVDTVTLSVKTIDDEYPAFAFVKVV